MAEISEWRRRALRHLLELIVLLELILSVAFLAVSVLRDNTYLRGVGVGLIIAWVTTGVALLYKRMAGTEPRQDM